VKSTIICQIPKVGSRRSCSEESSRSARRRHHAGLCQRRLILESIYDTICLSVCPPKRSYKMYILCAFRLCQSKILYNLCSKEDSQRSIFLRVCLRQTVASEIVGSSTDASKLHMRSSISPFAVSVCSNPNVEVRISSLVPHDRVCKYPCVERL
jgi:hypothetical protein